jgi:HTH-type transcriptional regulator/antitoxin HigA
MSPRDLIPFIGSRAKVSEVLAGKRPLTIQMARALHANLGIPADVLLQQPGGELRNALEGTEWTRFPLAEMAKRGWIEKSGNLLDHAEETMRDLMQRAGGEHALPAALYRKNDHARANAKTDPYALKAWCWEVLARALSYQWLRTSPIPSISISPQGRKAELVRRRTGDRVLGQSRDRCRIFGASTTNPS